VKSVTILLFNPNTSKPGTTINNKTKVVNKNQSVTKFGVTSCNVLLQSNICPR